MHNPQATAVPSSPPNTGWWWETALLVLLCYLKAGWPPPDVNEAHYLTKAKHFWNPEWCAGDFFLESADAHAPFFFAFGWVTLFLSLPAAAWVGRLITWTLLAWAWQRLSWTLAPVRFGAVLSGGLMIVLTTVGHMAGEWIVGGVEAKGFAFVLIFLGMEQLVRGGWSRAFALMGGAAAFHVLVGGWSVVAAGLAWLVEQDRPPLRTLWPGLVLGGALSLLGLVPGVLLNVGADAATNSEANYAYVYQRLPHHLVFHQFPHAWIARHAALAVLFFGLYAWLRTHAPRAEVRRLAGYVGGAVAIAVTGIVIDQSTLYFEDLAASLLRYYWYRLSDAMVPSGVALLLVVLYRYWQEARPSMAAWGMLVMLLAICGPLLSWNYARQQFPLPGATLQSGLQAEARTSLDETAARHADWVAMCRWVDAHLPHDAIFLTPRGQQTFNWYAQRAEVVSVKDIPQDARGIVEWRGRVNDVFAYPVNRYGYAALQDEEMAALANRYGATYVVVDSFPRMPGWKRVYPLAGESNDNFVVFEVPPMASTPREVPELP